MGLRCAALDIFCQDLVFVPKQSPALKGLNCPVGVEVLCEMLSPRSQRTGVLFTYWVLHVLLSVRTIVIFVRPLPSYLLGAYI